MFDELKKVLSEGFTIPVTLLVDVKFATSADEALFNSMTAVTKEIQPKAKVEIEVESQPETTADIEVKSQPKAKTKVKAQVEEPIVEEPTIEEQIVEEPIVEEQVFEPFEPIVPSVPVEPAVPVAKLPTGAAKEKIWSHAKVKYTPIRGEMYLRYGEINGNVIVKYEKLHFVTTWDEIGQMSKLTKDEFSRTNVLPQLGTKGKERVGKFLQYYRDGAVKSSTTPDEQTSLVVAADKLLPIIVKPIVKPTEKPVTLKPFEQKTDDRLFTPVKGDKNLKYKTSSNILTIKYEDATLSTTWNEIDRLADLTNYKLTSKIENMFKDSINHQKALLLFVKAFQAGKVLDPDAGFKPLLRTNTTTKYSSGYGGHVTGTLEDGGNQVEE